MSLNERIFLSLITKSKNFENRPHVAVGVSGGPDSMALAYLLKKWVKFKNGKLTALVFDHRIRSKSKDEAFQVRDMLKNLNIDTHIIQPDKNNVIKKNMASARDNRFEGIINFCKKKNILHLFLGHHFDDNLETYLIRKINGSNIEGLAAMKSIAYFNNIQLFRPFIKITKSSITNFNKKNNLMFINDPSNKNIIYTRVMVRKFLENTKYKKEIKKDFFSLKKQIPSYKKMIWEILIRYLTDVSSNKIIINFNKFIKYDDLIIEKHILCILNFLSKKKIQTKSSTITILINKLKKPGFKNFNLSGIIIIKSSDSLVFSQK